MVLGRADRRDRRLDGPGPGTRLGNHAGSQRAGASVRVPSGAYDVLGARRPCGMRLPPTSGHRQVVKEEVPLVVQAPSENEENQLLEVLGTIC